MTAAAAVSPTIVEPEGRLETLVFAVRDIATMTTRYVLRARYQMDVVLGSLIMPVIFVVLFGYVFGSSISVPGGHYREYLMSGLFAQGTIFASSSIATAVATDMSEGVMDRMRTLPIARCAVLVGRTLANVVVGLPSAVMMIACAFIVGWSPQNGALRAIGAFLLLQLFGYAMAWVGATIGMVARSPQAADVMSMLPSFLLGFISNVFVPTQNMPAWLRVVAQWNPLSAVVAAARDLFGTTQGGAVPQVWSLQHPVVTTFAMAIVLLAVFVPLSVRLYVKRVR